MQGCRSFPLPSMRTVRVASDLEGLVALFLTDRVTGEMSLVELDGAISHGPATELRTYKSLMDEGYLRIENRTRKIEVLGVSAAGDVSGKICRQPVIAEDMGCIAALDAGKFLNLDIHSRHVKVHCSQLDHFICNN